MRNKLYKLAAILIAVNMMSVTVLAAEDAAALNQPSSENTTTEDVQNGNDSSDADNNDNGSSDTGNGDTSQEEKKTEETKTEEQKPSASSDEQGQGNEGQGNESQGDAQTQQEEAPTDEEIADMLKETKRRTAKENTSSDNSSSDQGSSAAGSASDNSSWSNDGNITDVMGIRANVDGENVVISYKTKHSDQYEYVYGQNPITINYADGNGTGNNNVLIFDWDGFGVHGDNWSSIDGVTITKSSDQSDTEIVSISIPASWFKNMNFTVSGGNYTAGLVGTPVVEEKKNDAVYTGIDLDGTFNDWEAVSKSELNEPNGEHNVESVAWVIESDYVYIYIKDDGSNSATWAGPNHNGKYAITTDLGRTLIFQLTQSGAVVGADGAIANHTGSQWEIAIPTSSLPQNNGGLSFGLYLAEPTLEGYGNVAENKSATDIEYDGNYGDWDNYPHKEISYSNGGSNDNVPDGEAAIYVDNAVYGHCETRMQNHLNEKGGEFTQAVSVLVNDDWSHALYMRLVTVDSAGNINWNPDRQNLENGSYEYYIFDSSAWGTSKNINDLVEADVCYGKATITIQEGRHDMEWYVDSNKLAAKYGILESDMKTVSSQYGRIGQQLVTSAGASSGPVAGAGMCILSALVPFVIKKKFVLK